MSKDIKISWQGREYTIREDQVFEAGAEVEEVMSVNDIAQFETRPRFHKLAHAFSVLLNYAAGYEVLTPKAAHSAIMQDVRSGKAEDSASVAYGAALAVATALLDGAPDPDDTPVSDAGEAEPGEA